MKDSPSPQSFPARFPENAPPHALAVMGSQPGAAVPASSTPWSNSPTPEVSARAKKAGPRHTMELLFRHRKIVIGVFSLVMLAAIINTWSARRIYQATATLLVNTAPLEGETRNSNGSTIGANVEGVNQARKLETQMEILRTPDVIRGALGRLKDADRNAISEFYAVEITPVRNTDLLAVSVKSHSPEASAALSNAICSSYIDQSQEGNRREVGSAARYVQGQMDSVATKLEAARRTLKDFQQRNGISDMVEQARSVTTDLSTIKSELRQSRTERAALTGQISILQAAAARMPALITSSTTTPREAYTTLSAQLTKLRIDRVTARAKFTEDSRAVRDIDEQIARIQARLKQEKPSEISGTQKTANPARTAIEEEVARARGQVKGLDARVQVLEGALARANVELARLPEKSSRFGQLSSEVIALENNYRQLNEKYQALRINEEARLANARPVSFAKPPSAPTGSSRMRTLMMAAILGLALAYGLALLADRLDDRIHTSPDAEDAAQLPVIIDVPALKRKEQQTILAGSTSLLHESFEMLCTHIKLSSRHVPMRSITVTSSLPGEGKSVSSVNLAVAAAQSGQKVVLVDCDLRQPSLHRLFDLPNTRGFGDVVSEHCTVDDALQATSVRGLSLLSSGTPTQRPLELINSSAAQTCLDELTYMFDLVVVDTPPALLIADAALISTMTDATLLVVACDEVARPEVRRATQLLAQTGAYMPGIILTKVVPIPGVHHGYSGYAARRNWMGEGLDETPSLPSTPSDGTAHNEVATIGISPNGAAKTTTIRGDAGNDANGPAPTTALPVDSEVAVANTINPKIAANKSSESTQPKA